VWLGRCGAALGRGLGAGAMILAEAVTRTDIASYVNALLEVYILLIFVYILLNLLFSFGLRPPYWRWFDAAMNFLRDVCEPYLRIFRRFIPQIGMLDISPMIAIIVLYVVGSLVVQAIQG
jgi:YggT family protein